MVEPFAKEYLGADEVIGSEIKVTATGRATGFLQSPGVLVGVNKENAMHRVFGEQMPDVGMGDRATDYPFMSLCKVVNHPRAASVRALEMLCLERIS